MTPKIPCAMLAVAVLLAGCQEPAPPPPEARPVRTVTVERRAGGAPVSLTGQIRAQDEVSLAFRIDGRMLERRVNVGDRVKAGQLVARLDPLIQQNALPLGAGQPVGGPGPAHAGAKHLRAPAGAW